MTLDLAWKPLTTKHAVLKGSERQGMIAVGAKIFIFPRKTARMVLKAKTDKTWWEISFQGCYLEPPSCFAVVRKVWSFWFKPDSAILRPFQYRKECWVRLISLLEHLRIKLIRSFMTEKSCDNIGKVKRYETIDGACVSYSEEVFLPVDHWTLVPEEPIPVNDLWFSLLIQLFLSPWHHFYLLQLPWCPRGKYLCPIVSLHSSTQSHSLDILPTLGTTAREN